MTRALGASAWMVVAAEDGQQAVDRARAIVPDLILMDIDMPHLDGWDATAAIREGGPPSASVPILAYTALSLADAEILARGFDGRVAKPLTPEALVAAVSRWHPGERPRELDRLRTVFGTDEIAVLIAGFREQLAIALRGIDGDDRTAAHRIAGVAGILGFADVGTSWLLLSEGAAGAIDDARRTARMALAAIDRGTS